MAMMDWYEKKQKSFWNRKMNGLRRKKILRMIELEDVLYGMVWYLVPYHHTRRGTGMVWYGTRTVVPVPVAIK